MSKPQEFTLFIANNQGSTPRITCIDNHLYIEEEVKQLGTIFKAIDKSAYDKAISTLKLILDKTEENWTYNYAENILKNLGEL